MSNRTIRHALISVFNKEGLEPIVKALHKAQVTLLSTGGTLSFISGLGIPVVAVEDLTRFPEMLDGRVKTLHPHVFGGILARRVPQHLDQLEERDIPPIDLVIVDLYPFEKTVATTDDELAIIEKIDIGGISLIRAAAKNFNDVLVIPDRDYYPFLMNLLDNKRDSSSLEDRKAMARAAFSVTARYDTAIQSWLQGKEAPQAFHTYAGPANALRYGENPHQNAWFHGKLEQYFHQLHGKALSYNNLVDIESAMALIAEFETEAPAAVVIKHTNPCGVAVRTNLLDAWRAALAADPVSAFGGIIVVNRAITLDTASEIDQLFYEVLIAPGYSKEALELLLAKKNRIVLHQIAPYHPRTQFRSMLGGVLEQDVDRLSEDSTMLTSVTNRQASADEIVDLLFANKCAKHLKSNTIVLAKNKQLLGMGCGQTSRVDALRQAILKAGQYGFDLHGAVMASDAFFPFPDCVAIAHQAGIRAVIQPGGSIKDRESIEFCNHHNMAMVLTGNRHFKH